ncbi:asparagine synthase-domain-containing protein [Hyaloraphidium curvatum]|nr:asparagine synthase-domain-containing protein [Hyaloraphidium curvatum]
MCGILVRVRSPSPDTGQYAYRCESFVEDFISRRGPDHQGSHRVECGDLWQIAFSATVLHLRGDLCRQPVVTASGNVLCWNGELFGGLPGAEAREANDTVLVAAALERADGLRGILEVFSKARGEFAFVFYHASTATLWFARDHLGRRSLLWRLEPDGFTLASVGGKDGGFWELPVGGIFAVDMRSGGAPGLWTIHRWGGREPEEALSWMPTLREGREVPGNFSFFSEPPPSTFEATEWPPNASLGDILPRLAGSVDVVQQLLESAVRKRVCNIRSSGTAPCLAILFSGGLDCSLLAFMAARALPPGEVIDLINVAFENPRSLGARVKSQARDGGNVDDKAKYAVPDRLTARTSLGNLRAALPGRQFRLVEVNVPYSEAMEQKSRLLELMAPAATVMDLSIAMAIWFAVRGSGTGGMSEARVVLSGLGADELFGGYSRHRSRFQQGRWPALVHELNLDLQRLPSRNLGRDDRIVSDHGKELRLPFLDEDVLELCSRLPVERKCDPRLPAGLGDKLILRLLAHRLGLGSTATFPKRAIQFGARTAKMNGSERGDDAIE